MDVHLPEVWPVCQHQRGWAEAGGRGRLEPIQEKRAGHPAESRGRTGLWPKDDGMPAVDQG